MISTFLQILEAKRAEAFNELKDSIIKRRMMERVKLSGASLPTQLQNLDGANRHQMKGLKGLIKELDVLIAREKESPTDDTEPDLSLVLE